MDEPFFAPYLVATGKAHPGREETLARHETDPHKAAQMCLTASSTPYSFQKHMPQHMVEGFPMVWAKDAKHFFLIREPVRVIASYVRGRAEFEVEDLGFLSQRRLWEDLGRPPVIDSADILRAPDVMLERLCAAIDIAAPYWYHSVHSSTGFGAPPQSLPTLDKAYQPYLEAVQSDFDILFQNRLKL